MFATIASLKVVLNALRIADGIAVLAYGSRNPSWTAGMLMLLRNAPVSRFE